MRRKAYLSELREAMVTDTVLLTCLNLLVLPLLLLLYSGWLEVKRMIESLLPSRMPPAALSTLSQHQLAAMQGPPSLPGMASGAPSTSGPAPPPRPPGPARPTLARFRTEGYAGYSVAYSPFFPGLLAIASSANFGLVGNGRLHTFSMGQPPSPGVPNKRCVPTFVIAIDLEKLKWFFLALIHKTVCSM